LPCASTSEKRTNVFLHAEPIDDVRLEHVGEGLARRDLDGEPGEREVRVRVVVEAPARRVHPSALRELPYARSWSAESSGAGSKGV
jgi:hypothetical protein